MKQTRNERKPSAHCRTIARTLGLLLILTAKLGAEEAMKPEVSKPDGSKGNGERYPTLQYPPGFYKGGFFLSMIAGTSVSPGGSFIRHEKDYDRNLATGLQTGSYQNPMTGAPGWGTPASFDAQYSPGYSGQLELEYGTFSHFGFGFTMGQFSIKADRQDVFLSGTRPPIVTPVPMSSTLYRGTSALGLATYHPLEKEIFDPYIALRAGMVGFTGEAHMGAVPNPNRLNNSIQNGLGVEAGAGLGVNIHITRVVGFKAEATFHQQYLKSDQFSTRTLGTVTAQLGVVVNTTRLFPD